MRIFTEDEDTGARSTLGARVVDETDVGTPTGGSALSFVAPLAVAQGASAILRSAPGQLSGTVCVRITLRERKRPLRFCNRYASARRALGPRGGREHRRRGRRLGRADGADRLDDFKPRRLHVTEFAARVKLRRGLRQAFIRSVTLPRRVRRGHRVRARLNLQVVRGPRITRTFRLRIPSVAAAGQAAPHASSARTSTTPTPTSSARWWRRSRSAATTRRTARATSGRARSTRSPAASATSRRYDGVTLRAGGNRAHAYRDADLRISGRASPTVRVRR